MDSKQNSGGKPKKQDLPESEDSEEKTIERVTVDSDTGAGNSSNIHQQSEQSSSRSEVDSKPKNSNNSYFQELTSELAKRYTELNMLSRNNTRHGTASDGEEIELLEMSATSTESDDPVVIPTERELKPPEQEIISVSRHNESETSVRIQLLPTLWGKSRHEIQIEFPNLKAPSTRPVPQILASGKDTLDLRDHYATIMTPADLEVSEAIVECNLFRREVRYSLQETRPWMEVAEKYVHELPQRLQMGPLGSPRKGKDSHEGKSRDMRIAELKNRALNNIIHHDNFTDITEALAKRSAETSDCTSAPALLVHNGFSFLSITKTKADHSGETLTERQTRLLKEKLERQKKKLHDLEVIFDTEVIVPDPNLSSRYVDIEIETDAMDSEASPEIQFEGVETWMAPPFWAIVQINLQRDGTKVYEIKTPVKGKPKFPISKTTHRRFVVSSHVAHNSNVVKKETDDQDKPVVSPPPPAQTPAQIIAQTYWAIAIIELLTDGTKVYEVRKPRMRKPIYPIPATIHRQFVVSPEDVFNKV